MAQVQDFCSHSDDLNIAANIDNSYIHSRFISLQFFMVK